MDSITAKEKKSIDEALANLLFAWNVDLVIVKSKYFLEPLHLLRSAYSPPTFEMITTTNLNNVFKKINQDVIPKSSKTPCMLFLSPVNHCNIDNILSVVKDLYGNIFFLNNFLIYGDHREQELERIASEAIELSNEHFLDVFVIVSNDITVLSSTMLSIWLIPCNILIINLIAESLANATIYNPAVDLIQED